MWPKRRNKYGAKPVVDNGQRFDSTSEFRRYCTLKLMERAGEIHGLELHPVYKLRVDGHDICEFEPDFRYLTATGQLVAEDSKSPATITPEFKLKAKLFRALYGIEVTLTGKGI
jgi:hypothetical protein